MKDYSLLTKQAKSLLTGESDSIANAANLAALIYHSFENVNWAGFYFLRGKQLVLGPFIGQVACTRIDIGKGVCGTAFQQKKTELVADVHKFEGHIACDVASESEIVVPFYTNTLSGVLDIDSPIKGRFGPDEAEIFETLVKIYTSSIT